jgi:hypothetical protein
VHHVIINLHPCSAAGTPRAAVIRFESLINNLQEEVGRRLVGARSCAKLLIPTTPQSPPSNRLVQLIPGDPMGAPRRRRRHALPLPPAGLSQLAAGDGRAARIRQTRPLV